MQRKPRPSTPPSKVNIPPGTSAFLARAGFSTSSQISAARTPFFLSSTLALRRRQGETLLSTKLLAPGNRASSLLAQLSSAMRANLMSMYLLLGFLHDEAGRL